MKKIIGLLGVVIVSATLFLSTNNINSIDDANADINEPDTRTVKNYNLTFWNNVENFKRYDEDDCVKKWAYSALESGMCTFD